MEAKASSVPMICPFLKLFPGSCTLPFLSGAETDVQAGAAGIPVTRTASAFPFAPVSLCMGCT